MTVIIEVPNMYEPATRQVRQLTISDGATLDSLLPHGWSRENGQTIASLNGNLTQDWQTPVNEGDIVVFVASPDGPVLPYLVLGVILTVIGTAIAEAATNVPDASQATAAVDPPDGAFNNGFYGFRNNFFAEGAAVPIVYGRHRVAGPVINRLVAASTIGQNQVADDRETMFLMVAVSEGPIEGFGTVREPIRDAIDFEAAAGSAEGAASKAGLQINKIDGAIFETKTEWRTGEVDQSAIIGENGFFNYTDAATTYVLTVVPQTYPGDLEAPASGTDPFGINDFIDEVGIPQKNLGLADRVVIGIVIERGLGETQEPGGPVNPTRVFWRVQAREIDSVGNPTSDWLIYPVSQLIAESRVRLAVDIPLPLADPETFVVPENLGHIYLQNDTQQYLRNDDNSALATLDLSDSWTFMTHVCLADIDHAGPQGINNHLFMTDTVGGTTNELHGATTNVFGNPLPHTNYAFQPKYCSGGGCYIHIFVDINDQYTESGYTYGGEAVYLSVCSWNAAQAQSGPNGIRVYNPFVQVWRVGSRADWGPDSWHHVAVRHDTGSTYEAWYDGIKLTETQKYNSTSFAPGGGAGNPYELVRIGAWLDNLDTGYAYRSMLRLTEWMLLKGFKTDSYIESFGSTVQGTNLFGQKTSRVDDVAAGSDFDEAIILRMNGGSVKVDGATSFENNLAALDDTVYTPALFDMNYRSATGVEQTGGPIHTQGVVNPKESRWEVEFFCGSSQIVSDDLTNELTLDSMVFMRSENFVYPQTAVASIAVKASDMISQSRPAITLLCYGRKVPVWDGTYGADDKPVLVEQWSANPAWIAADLLSHERYGLGGEVGVDRIDWPSFLEWAEYCDEAAIVGLPSVPAFAVQRGQSGTRHWIRLLFGLTQTDGTVVRSLSDFPATWVTPPYDVGEPQVEHYLTISEVYGAVNPDWITFNDVVGGLNDANARLAITKAQTIENASFHGWEKYRYVEVNWNRFDAAGDPILPYDLALGEYLFADDDYGQDSLFLANAVEERCRFDGVIESQEQKGWDTLINIFQAGRAMPMKIGDKVYAIVDKPRPPVAVFGQGNIVEGSMTLTYRDKSLVPNSIESDILDSAANYDRATILVDHPTIQDPTLADAFRKENIKLVGVTRRSQALRDCTYRLNRYHLLDRTVTFSVGPDAIHLLPGDRFKFSHDVPQYGYSGRLRNDFQFINSFPLGGDIYAGWNREGGPNVMTAAALLFSQSVTLPTAHTGSSLPSVEMRSMPTAKPGQTGPAASVNASGSEFNNGGAYLPTWATQIVSTSNALYPDTQPLDQIIDISNYQSTFSVYVQEPALGAAPVFALNFYLFLADDGSLVNHDNYAYFEWQSGALVSVSTDASLSVSVTNAGNGWYRVAATYTAASDAGASEGDYLQLRMIAYPRPWGTDTEVWKPVVSGGKGVQFFRYGDPLKVNYSAAWYPVNNGTPGNQLANDTTIYPPYYSDFTGAYGYVGRIKTGIATSGTNAMGMVQTVDLPSGTAVPTWNGETIVVQGYLRIGPGNVRTDTKLTVQVREGTAQDVNGLLTGDGIDAVYTYNGSTFTTTTPTTVGVSGTVANEASSLEAVYQNSTTNDPVWQRFVCHFDYTPTSGDLTEISVLLSCDAVGSTTDTREVCVWGLQCHGVATTGSSPNNIVNYAGHIAVNLWGAQYEKDASAASSFAQGGRIFLDRDITLEAGKEYELLVRSSFTPDTSVGGDGIEVLQVESSQVPGSGTATITNNTELMVSTPQKFAPREGDIYSFGEVNRSHYDFTVQSIDLDPETMQRTIKGLLYDEAVYDDSTFGVQGVQTISDLPDPNAQSEAMARLGMGWGYPENSAGRYAWDAALTPQLDRQGGVTHELQASWKVPLGVLPPPKVRIWYSRQFVNRTTSGFSQPRPFLAGEVSTNERRARFNLTDLEDNTNYTVYFQPVGDGGTGRNVLDCPRVTVRAQTTLKAAYVPAPALTVTTRGFEQVYQLPQQRGERRYDLIEGRIGGWVMGAPAFAIDPDNKDFHSDATLVGQASTPTGRTGMTIHARKRMRSGSYGVVQRIDGDEQIADVTYTYSTSNENDWTAPGALSFDLDLDGDVLIWKSGSTALSATYLPAQIDLGEAKRVIANCAVEAYQIRPETLEDCNFALGDAIGARWSLEGPMDNRDDDNSDVLIEWRWTSAASFTTETFRTHRPGEVYARLIQYRITFNRPTAAYGMRCERVLTQALELPAFTAGDIDGGTY